MSDFQLLVNDIILSKSGEDLIILGAVCAVIMGITAVLVACEIRKTRGTKND